MGVRRKLYVLLGVCVLGFVCSVFAGRIGRHYSEKYRTLEALAANAYVELLQARGEEKNFLLHRDSAAIEGVFRHVFVDGFGNVRGGPAFVIGFHHVFGIVQGRGHVVDIVTNR